MTSIKPVCCILLALFLASTLPATPTASAAPAGDPESISGSYVYFTGVISPDDCSIPGHSQAFCLQAISYTNDWDYVYYLWQRFPDDWTVQNVYVEGTPYCVNGGTFGPFSWSGAGTPEVRIVHVRYHANPSDTCSVYYCFEVTSGSHSPGVPYAAVSWYWVSSMYGSPPYYPCSSDNYTPAGQATCDEASTPPAFIEQCTMHTYLPVVFRNW